MFSLHPLIILVIGMLTVILMITVLKMNAFIALITSAVVVSLLAPGDFAEKISRVAEAFGNTAGSIGIVIALAVVIGKCMMDSGAADRIVRAFLSVLGEKRSSTALMASGFVLSIPVFFDTVFYLLVPLARSMHRRTKKHYLKYAMAIVAGGVVTHSLVPPTPGPLIVADNLGIDIGVMIMVGALVALPAAIIGMIFSGYADRRMNIPMRPLGGELSEPEPLEDHQLPGLLISLLPIILPVLLVSTNTIVRTIAKGAAEGSGLNQAAAITAVLGNVNLAMLLSTAIAMWMLKSKRALTNVQLAKVVEVSLMSGGVIILITAGGGAFGAMLKAAQIGPAIEKLFTSDTGQPTSGLMLLVLGALIAVLMKIAQGSTTVAMITSSAMIGSMITSTQTLGYHPVYLAAAIGGGSMVGSWMNDSGFWIFVKMSGLTEAEGLKTWTPLLAIVGLTSIVVSLLLALILPMA
ncbi:MAG: gluconate permease [Planctomycetes bacterium]|nr:gluconate permease [Planctomycetota bacterium]MBL7144532.1 gluconate permease [Phycisphaerae bacterium]